MILDALERLLVDARLRDLGVDEIAGKAGITRARFYSYYKSKHEAYAALLVRIRGEILRVYDLPSGWLASPTRSRPRQALAEIIRTVGEVWLKHGPGLREASDLWNSVPEVRDTWYEIVFGLADRVAGAIERDRALGLAPPGPDAGHMAEGLIWMGERMFFLRLIDAPRTRDLDALVETGTSMWMRSIYLADDPDPVQSGTD